MKPETLSLLRRLHEEATPAPWEAHDDENGDGWLMAGAVFLASTETYASNGDGHALSNAALIAAARNALPELLSYVERTKALLKRIEWQAEDRTGDCIACGGREPHDKQPAGTTNVWGRHYGHAEGCELAALLGEAKPPAPVLRPDVELRIMRLDEQVCPTCGAGYRYVQANITDGARSTLLTCTAGHSWEAKP